MGNLQFIDSREFRLALGLYKTGLWDACIRVVNRNRFSKPSSTENVLNWEKLAIRLHLRRKDWRSAQEIAQLAVINFPQNPTLIHLLGRTWEMQGKSGMEQANACFTRVWEMAPRWLPNLKRLVSTKRKLGRLKETILHLRELVSLDPGCPKALSNLVLCLRQMGHHQEADTLVKQGRFLFASCPNFAFMYNALQCPSQKSSREIACTLPFVKPCLSLESNNYTIPIETPILRIQDHPKSRVMFAFSIGGLRRS